MDRFQYLIVLAVCVAVTLPLELGPARLGLGARVWRRPSRLARSVLPVAGVFLVWDVAATYAGTWRFDERYTLGVTLPGGMAIEELGFFVVVPVCGLLTLVTVRRVLALSAAGRSPAQPPTMAPDARSQPSRVG